MTRYNFFPVLCSIAIMSFGLLMVSIGTHWDREARNERLLIPDVAIQEVVIGLLFMGVGALLILFIFLDPFGVFSYE